MSTRDKLLEIAAQIFVEKGYEKATTREICQAADINITSIHYHFGSKSDLYRAIFIDGFGNFPKPDISFVDITINNLHEQLVNFYRILLEPFMDGKHPHHPEHHRNDKLHHLAHKLIKKEQFEPSGLVDDLLLGPAKFIHEPLVMMLKQIVNISEEEIHRLAFTIVAIGFSLVHPQHIVMHYAPNLLLNDDSKEQMFDKLATYAKRLILLEL